MLLNDIIHAIFGISQRINEHLTMESIVNVGLQNYLEEAKKKEEKIQKTKSRSRIQVELVLRSYFRERERAL